MSGFEAGLLRRLLEFSPRDRVLDLACGHGRHARALSPEVGRELTRLAATAPVLVELWLGGPELYELGRAADRTAAQRTPSAGTLTPTERAALRLGILQALGATSSPAADGRSATPGRC